MITKQNIVDMIRSGMVRGFLTPEFNAYEMKITEMGTYTGITFIDLKDDSVLKATPVFNLDSAMDILRDAETKEEACEKLSAMIENFMKNAPDFNTDMDFIKHILSSYENAKPYIYMDAVSTDYFNEQAIIHEKNGMKFAPKFLISNNVENGEGRAVAPVPMGWLKSMGVSQEDLINYAINNTANLTPVDITSMGAITEEYWPENGEDKEFEKIYIVSNKNKTHGAALILNDYVKELLYNKYKSDYYVIPSSVHEVITIPIDSFNPPSSVTLNYLMEMVSAVNNTLAPEDILGYEVSIYNGKSKNLEKATEYCINKNIDKIRTQRYDELMHEDKNKSDERPKL